MAEGDQMNEKPPTNKDNMDNGTGLVPPLNPLARRFTEFGKLWRGDWDICPVRSPICSRCHVILKII